MTNRNKMHGSTMIQLEGLTDLPTGLDLISSLSYSWENKEKERKKERKRKKEKRKKENKREKGRGD